MRHIAFFYNQGNRGWVESWWTTESGVPTSLPSDVADVAKKAKAFRNDNVYLAWIRFSSPDTPGRTFGVAGYEAIAGQSSDPDSGPGDPDNAATAAVWQIYGSEGARRAFTVRGLRDGSVVWSNNYQQMNLTPAAQKQVRNYLDAVKSLGWGIRHVPSGLIAAPNQKYVASVTPQPGNLNGVYVVPTTTLGALPANVTALAIGGNYDKRLLPYFPKIATIIGVLDDAGTQKILIQYGHSAEMAAVIPRGMRVRWAQYSFQAMTSYTLSKVSTRDTGRPFGSGRGRQSAAVSSR